MDICKQNHEPEDAQQKNRLLTEYQVCEQSIEHYETLVWHTASIFLVLSITGLGFFLRDINCPSWARCIMICTAAGVVMIVLLSWKAILARWWSYQQVKWYRMREIEKDLEFWNSRYIHHLDAPKSEDSDNQSDDNNKCRLNNLKEKTLSGYQNISAKNKLIFIIHTVIIAWFVRAAIEAVLIVT
ncbi:MAG: hypothetical protein GY847_18120 [Proteobacteria bacterium]|nr:hypothetical protein [Pseudomonadota bacterium]